MCGRVAVEIDDKKIDAIFSGLNQCHLPGVSVGIALNGRPVYRKGFGLANMELSVLLSPTMRMRIASTTKHFAALTYMLLCEGGKAGIDDPIGAYLPELHPTARKVTARQLMGNIGGLRDAHDISWQFSGRGRRVSCAELLSLYRDIDDVNAEPGTAWIYCNGGFLLLSTAIERITGQSLEDVLRERIFAPVGMHDTLLRRWDSDFVANSATLHMRKPTGEFDRSYLGTALAGEGGVVSTVDDMLRWLAHMDVPIVGSAATWAVMKTPQRLANGTSTGYGLGLMSGHYRGVATISHSGGVMGGTSQMLKVPAAGLDVAIMANRGDVLSMDLVNRILDACIPSLSPLKSAFKGPFAAGVFRSPVTGRVVHLFAKEGQQFASMDGVDLPVEPDQDGVFWPAGTYDVFKQAVILVGDPQAPSMIRLNHFGTVDELVPVRSVGKADVSAIAGRYRSDSTGTTVTVGETSGGPHLTCTGKFGSATYRLECVAEGIWRARSDGTTRDGLFSFDSNGASLSFSNDRVWGLSFRRDD